MAPVAARIKANVIGSRPVWIFPKCGLNRLNGVVSLFNFVHLFMSMINNCSYNITIWPGFRFSKESSSNKLLNLGSKQVCHFLTAINSTFADFNFSTVILSKKLKSITIN